MGVGWGGGVGLDFFKMSLAGVENKISVYLHKLCKILLICVLYQIANTDSR